MNFMKNTSLFILIFLESYSASVSHLALMDISVSELPPLNISGDMLYNVLF